ncbi:hypothetical protein SDJN03_17101, partial [Cucurbita argyrosperma subsp. sororia]
MFGRAGRSSLECQKRWLVFLVLSNQRMRPFLLCCLPVEKASICRCVWIERKLGIDIDPSAYPEYWKEINGFSLLDFPITVSNLHWHKDLLTATSTTYNEFTKTRLRGVRDR